MAKKTKKTKSFKTSNLNKKTAKKVLKKFEFGGIESLSLKPFDVYAG